jgi:signal transduction histidine kinase
LALTLAGFLAVMAIAVALMLILHREGVEHERRLAESHTRLAADAVIAPLINRELMNGDPAALAALDEAVRRLVLVGPIKRVKLWAPDGSIVYSDEPRLIGMRFALEPDELETLATGEPTSELTDLGRPENRFERGDEALVEVYTRVRAPSGDRLLFEAYQDADSVGADSGTLFVTVLPALGGGLLLLALASLAEAWWFARYVRRRDRQRAAMLAQTLDASNIERRRIAADLHDGVVQDLTAATLSLGTTTRQHAGEMSGRTVATLTEIEDTMRRGIISLRTVLMNVYPADLDPQGFHAAIGDLVRLAARRGVHAELDLEPGFRAPTTTSRLLLRVAQEALQNATTHAGAGLVLVSVGDDGRCYWLEVRDDGMGFDTAGDVPLGHFGLRVVRDLVTDAGGTVTMRSSPGRGAILRVDLPRGGT